MIDEETSDLVKRLREHYPTHRMVIEATLALASLSLQLEASERLRKAAEEDSKRILDINRKHCDSVNTYVVLNARLQERADILTEQNENLCRNVASLEEEVKLLQAALLSTPSKENNT